MAKEPLEPETVDQLKDLFSQMDLDGNRNITWEEAEAFFLQLFDELPKKTIEQSYRRMPRVGIAPPAEALSVSQKPLAARKQAAALFADVDADNDNLVSCDEFLYFWEMVKGNGYSDEEILRGLTAALARGLWGKWTRDLIAAPAPLPAWAALQLPASADRREAYPQFLPTLQPYSGSLAVLPLPGVAEPHEPLRVQDYTPPRCLPTLRPDSASLASLPLTGPAEPHEQRQDCSPPHSPTLRPDSASLAVLPMSGLAEPHEPTEAGTDELVDEQMAQNQIRLLCGIHESEPGGYYVLLPD
jgi:hypothetical protein